MKKKHVNNNNNVNTSSFDCVEHSMVDLLREHSNKLLQTARASHLTKEFNEMTLNVLRKRQRLDDKLVC